jgi:effector-binding domain-containing protein
MVRRWKARTAVAIVVGLILLASPLFPAPSRAQPAPAASPSPASTAAPALAPAAPAPTPSPSTGPTPAATGSPANPEASKPDEGGSMGETVELTSRPAATAEGKADRDEVFGAITGSIDLIRTEIAKAGLKAAGRPIAVFLEADDVGFRYRAAIPLESTPEGKTELSDAVKLGPTPVGKAMRFEHRGAYDDIDATYEAITAYLDEKGVDAQDLFIEEYLNDVKTPDDPNLQVDIFVLLK